MSDFTISVTHPRCYYDLSTDQPEVHPSSVCLAENTIVVKALFRGHPNVSSNKHSPRKTFGCLKTFNFTALSSEKQVLSAYQPSVLLPIFLKMTHMVGTPFERLASAVNYVSILQHCTPTQQVSTASHWGAACVNTFQVCSWPSIRRTVLPARSLRKLCLWKFLGVPPTARRRLLGRSQ